MKWAYGITTVPDRKLELFPTTLDSLRAAGFDKPRLFVDGATEGYEHFGCDVTYRATRVKTVANWMLGLLELYVRDPFADRYALFQDDFLTSLGLREYLERTPYPEAGYCNLYTFPEEQSRAAGVGWYASTQRGLGAVALVFNYHAARILLTHQHMIDKVRSRSRGTTHLDGGIVETFRKCGWKEFIHNPSLVQHSGLVSSMGNGTQPLATSFLGAEFDLRNLA